MDPTEQSLTAQEFQALESTGDWRVIGRDAMAWFPTLSHAAGAERARRIIELGTSPPDLDVRTRGPLRIRLHVDVAAPTPAAARTVAALPDLGGEVRLAHDYYCTVADADGNEVDLLPLPEGSDGWGDAATEDWRLVFAAVAAAALCDEADLAMGIDLRPGLVVLDTGKDL